MITVNNAHKDMIICGMLNINYADGFFLDNENASDQINKNLELTYITDRFRGTDRITYDSITVIWEQLKLRA